MLTPFSKPSRLTSMNSARRALEPRRRHPAIVVPHGGEAVPVAGVAPQHPVLDDLPDGGFFVADERLLNHLKPKKNYSPEITKQDPFEIFVNFVA